MSAAVLGAEMCEIYTDVDGVFTTDPRQIADARKMSNVSHDEMLELGQPWRGRDAQPIDRVRQKIQRANPRTQ